MKKKPINLDAMRQIEQDSVSDAVKMAAANFMILSVSVGKFEGIKNLKEAAKAAAKAANAKTEAELRVRLLGDYHSELRTVLTEYSKMRTLLKKITIDYESPEKLGHVAEIPRILKQLAEQKLIAEGALAAFLPEYDRYVKASLESQGLWAKEVKRHLPSAEKIASQFYITINDPKPVPAMDMASYGCVPTSTMGKIVTASNKALAIKLEQAKSNTMDKALKAVEKIVTQLSKDAPRMHDSVIEHAKIASTELRNMADGYDGDLRLSKIADVIDKEVINVDQANQWGANETKKVQACAAAQKTVSNIKALQKAAPVADVPATDTLLTGGLLADLL